jgi:histidine kinase
MRLDLYGAMFHASYCYNPPLFVTNRARIIATCFVDGSSRFSALAFMSYGVHLCCQRMSTQIAQRFAKQALAYQLRTEDSYGPALVLFLHTTYILQFALDPHAVISRMEQDLCAVDALGDTNWGSIFRFELLLRYLLAGVPLDYLVEQCGQFEKFAIKRAGSGPAITIRLLKSLACCFSSVHESCPFCTNSPQNSGWAPDALKPEWSYNRDFFQMLRFYLRNDFVDVCTVGGKLSDVFLRDRLPNIRAHPIVPAWCLLYGLAICRCVLTGPAQELTRMRRKLTSLCDELNWWSKAGPNHYEHDAQFLLGAAAYACGDRATASFNITAALDAYEKSRSDLKAALAAEFLGYVHLTDHNQKVADIFLTRALAAYSRWGAVSKVKELNSLIAREDEVCRASEQQGIAQHELTTLSTAVAEVSAAQNMPTLMATVQRIAGCWTGTERQAFVLLIEGKMISSAKSTQAIQKPMEENSTDIPVNVARKVLQSGKIFHIFDSSLHSDLLNDSYFTKRPARSLLCLPVAVGDELLGLLYLEGTPGHSTFSGLVSFLSILVAHAAGRIQYMMLQQTMLDQMKHYSRNLEGAQDRLIRFNRMALETQMAGGFAHEMRNILASASVVADAALRPSNTLAAPLQALVDSLSALYELCENNLPEPKRPEARHLLQQAVDSALFLENALKGVMTATTRGLKLTSETLEYARSGGVRNRPREAIEMAGLLNGLVEELRPQFSKFHVRLDLDLTTAPVVLAAFEPDLYAVFKNLLVNAFDAVCSKADLVHRRVCVIMRTVEAGVNIQISDSGIGIAKKDARRIYEPFFSTKETGTGLGLAVVKKLIDMYEGTIECRSVYGEGTNFTVVWPSVS